jgi:hypothetical protein
MRQSRYDFDCCSKETKSVPRTSDCNENLNTVIVFNSQSRTDNDEILHNLLAEHGTNTFWHKKCTVQH